MKVYENKKLGKFIDERAYNQLKSDLTYNITNKELIDALLEELKSIWIEINVEGVSCRGECHYMCCRYNYERQCIAPIYPLPHCAKSSLECPNSNDTCGGFEDAGEKQS